MKENFGDDLWTFFGQFSSAEIEKATRLLSEAGIPFEVKEDQNWCIGGGWGGPHCLWVRDEFSGNAAALLIPLFDLETSIKNSGPKTN